MTDKGFEQRAADYLTGEMPEDERARFEAELESDPGAAGEMAASRRVLDRASEPRGIDPGDAYFQSMRRRVWERIDEESHRGARHRVWDWLTGSWLRPVAVALPAAAALAFALWLFGTGAPAGLGTDVDPDEIVAAARLYDPMRQLMLIDDSDASGSNGGATADLTDAEQESWDAGLDRLADGWPDPAGIASPASIVMVPETDEAVLAELSEDDWTRLKTRIDQAMAPLTL